jgi:sulfotransferase famil protein
MISHKHQCIFIHIPKCAGTSIESLLGHHKNYSGRCKQDHRSISDIQKQISHHRIFQPTQMITHTRVRLQNMFRAMHGDCKLNVNNFNIVTQSQYDKYFKFCFVGNPWSRAFSWYRNVIRDEIHRALMGIK